MFYWEQFDSLFYIYRYEASLKHDLTWHEISIAIMRSSLHRPGMKLSHSLYIKHPN